MTENVNLPADRVAIEPTPDQLATVADLPAGEPVVMLNLLRFREVADYSEHPDLAPVEPISGVDAYQRYGDAAWPHLAAASAQIVYHGSARSTLIGPVGEQWDQVVLVRYPSPEAFLGMVSTPEYRHLTGHRIAALADSRLVPTSETENIPIG